MVGNHPIDNQINKIHYLLYDGECNVCRLCAWICKKIFVNTVFVSYKSFKKHWGMFPSLVNKCNTTTVNLFAYSDKEWLYGEDALMLMCITNNQPITPWVKLFNLASMFRKKCSKCKLSSEVI